MKTRRTTKLWRWLLSICLAVMFVCFVVPSLLPEGPRWYALNPRYALWKFGWHAYDQRIVYKGLNGDIWRDEVVRGKSLVELRAMFMDIREIPQFDTYSLTKVSALTNSTRTFVKWGETDWFIELNGGRATSIHLWKG